VLQRPELVRCTKLFAASLMNVYTNLPASL